jgi:hypothetical protein
MEKLKEVLLKFFKLESIVSNISGYVESRVALVKMELREEVASVISRSLIVIIMMLIGFLLVLFLSIGMAGYLNTLFEGSFAGFFIVGGFYGLLLLMMIAFRKSLLTSLEKKFTKMIRQKQD